MAHEYGKRKKISMAFPSIKCALLTVLWTVSLIIPEPATITCAKELKQETIQAFDKYVQAAETDMEKRATAEGIFLWIGDDPGKRKQARQGEIVVAYFCEKGGTKVPDGLIHDWIGTVFIPGDYLDETLSLLQDFDRHKEIYPEVIDSKLLERKGNFIRGYLQFLKKKVITVVLNTVHEARYFQLSDRRWHCRSYTKRIAEVKDHGKSGEHELPVGDGRGFLWRLYAYWRLEHADGGIYAECRSISLSRRVPRGLGWIVNPFIREMPEKSLRSTLTATRASVLKKEISVPPDN